MMVGTSTSTSTNPARHGRVAHDASGRIPPLLVPLILAALVGGLFFAAGARAHVEVLPDRAVQNEPRVFTVKAPNERDIATVAVRVLFPPEMSVYSVQPTPGWSARWLLTPDKRNRGIVFSGGTIRRGQFQQFSLLAAPLKVGTAIWKADQTYADGKVKSWSGPIEVPGQEAAETGVDAPGPASATEVVAEGEAADAGVAVAGDSGSSEAGLWLGVIAIAVAGLSALGVGLLWSSRPGRLPDDPSDE